MYKITFNMKTPICFIDKPIFDAIIAYCYTREYLGDKFKQALNYDEKDLIDFEAMPIKRHKDGYFIATWMIWDKEVEYQGSWKKRWANEHDHLADFGKLKRKIRINAGEHKSYDMPMNLHHIPKVWFYFDSENINEVKRLIDKWIFGIGKKTSQGYGEFSSYVIEKAEFDFQGESCRPIPISEEQFLEMMKAPNQSLSVKYTGFRPPYWLPSNQGYCVC